MNIKALELIKFGEGFRASPYYCTAGALTIGYGYNLDANPLKLSVAEIADLKAKGIDKNHAAALLARLLESLEHQLQQDLPWLSKLNADRQAVLLDMAYNLGVDGLLKFKKTLAHLERGDYEDAGREMLDSTWARQVKTRACRNAAIIRTGKLKL